MFRARKILENLCHQKQLFKILLLVFSKYNTHTVTLCLKKKVCWASSNGSYLMEEIIHETVLLNNNTCVPIVIFSTLKWKI